MGLEVGDAVELAVGGDEGNLEGIWEDCIEGNLVGDDVIGLAEGLIEGVVEGLAVDKVDVNTVDFTDGFVDDGKAEGFTALVGFVVLPTVICLLGIELVVVFAVGALVLV